MGRLRHPVSGIPTKFTTLATSSDERMLHELRTVLEGVFSLGDHTRIRTLPEDATQWVLRLFLRDSSANREKTTSVKLFCDGWVNGWLAAAEYLKD